MRKHKKLFIGLFVTLSVLVAAGGGLFYWHASRVASHPEAAQTAGTTTTPSGYATDSNGMPIIHDQTSTTGGPQNQQVAGASTSTPSTGNSNPSTNPLDASTFSQYDKYKNDQSAYFIELQQGTGDALTAGKQAAVYYRGWLTNGQLFDQSRTGSDGKLQAFTFTQGQHEVIAGWEQTLEGMKVGGVRLLIVPPSVGYGANGQGSIPGNAVLVFQVQLVAVQ